MSTDTSPVQTFLLSPDVDTQDSAIYKESGFYLLRKDSERRQTMVRILEQDMDKICANWLTMLKRDKSIAATKLTVDHLSCLLGGIKEYILNQNAKAIKGAIDTVREYVQFDASALSEIQLALCECQEAVSTNLRAHNIKPHWMFALDNLIRGAVQVAITILSPDVSNLWRKLSTRVDELGANLAGGTVEEEVVTSGVSSANSGKLTYPTQTSLELGRQVSSVQEQNVILLQELLEAQKEYQSLLQQALREKKMSKLQLRVILTGEGSLDSSRESSPGADADTENGDESDGAHSDVDPKLISWLQSLNLDQETIRIVSEESYTLQDILELVTWEDIRELKIRGGMRCRIWRAILRQRTKDRDDG